jgi:hypothetical protein
MLLSFLSNASCSSRRRSASSLLSYSPSVSDESDDAGRNAVCCSRWWMPRSFRTEEDDEGPFAREGELFVREFRRARSLAGLVSWMNVDGLERLSLQPAPEIRRGKLGSVPLSSGAASALSRPSCMAWGLKEPLMEYL